MLSQLAAEAQLFIIINSLLAMCSFVAFSYTKSGRQFFIKADVFIVIHKSKYTVLIQYRPIRKVQVSLWVSGLKKSDWCSFLLSFEK